MHRECPGALKDLMLLLPKYQIAKRIGVRWQTIHNWSLGYPQPTKENLTKLQILRIEEIEKRGLSLFPA